MATRIERASAISLSERFRTEKAKWDDIAEKQSCNVEVFPSGMDFRVFARHDEEFPGVSEFLGNLAGIHVLELGCSAGMMTVPASFLSLYGYFL